MEVRTKYTTVQERHLKVLHGNLAEVGAEGNYQKRSNCLENVGKIFILTLSYFKNTSVPVK